MPYVLQLMFFFLFFIFFSLRDLRTPSADRRETLPHRSNPGALYNGSPKIREPSPKEIGGPKHAKFGPISYNFKVRSRISPEWVKISKIGKRIDREQTISTFYQLGLVK